MRATVSNQRSACCIMMPTGSGTGLEPEVADVAGRLVENELMVEI
jgi:hypothetical protein